MLKISFIVAVASLAAGCAGVASTERQEVSSGFIGCAPQEIAIVNTGSANWEATCKGKTFYCTVSPTAMCTAKM